MKKLVLSILASAALVTPALACPNSDHDNNAPRTAENKDAKDGPKADKAKEAPKSDTKTDTAKNTKETPKSDAKPAPAKDSKDTAKKPDKVSSK